MNVICPKCNERGVVVDVEDGESLSCGACNESYTVSDVRALVESWGPVLAWLSRHPARVAEAVART